MLNNFIALNYALDGTKKIVNVLKTLSIHSTNRYATHVLVMVITPNYYILGHTNLTKMYYNVRFQTFLPLKMTQLLERII